MEKKKSLLVINESNSQRTAMYFSREFSRLININENMIHHLVGNFSKEDLTETMSYFIKDSIRLYYPDSTQYLLYIYINIQTENLIDDSLVSIMQNIISQNSLESRHITFVIMSERHVISKKIDFQLKKEEGLLFNWITIFNKNIEDIDYEPGAMIMTLILVFLKCANTINDIQLAEMFNLLLTEMHGSWVGDSQIPVLTVSNDDLFVSYVF